jgi:NAD(P)-dependent dehydrogenase (short-subunit alcohol dehydrogenase family)
MITGAARGIGRCCAQALSEVGARVAVADLDEDEAHSSAQALPGEAQGFRLDVANSEDFQTCVQSVESALGPIQILINNAGVMHIGPMESLTAQTEARMMEINLLGPLHGVHAIRESMRSRGGGLVVNIASLVARVPLAYTAAYSATKAGVAGLTEALRVELHDEGIQLMGVYPGYVRTDLTSGVPLPRFPRAVTPEDVAQGLVRGIELNRASVYVPRIGRVFSMLRPLLPLPVVRHISALSGTLDLFERVNEAQRRDYRKRSGRNHDR